MKHTIAILLSLISINVFAGEQATYADNPGAYQQGQQAQQNNSSYGMTEYKG